MKFIILGLVSWLLFPRLISAEGSLSRIISSNNAYSTPTQTQTTDLKIGVKSDYTIPNGKFQILIYAGDNTNLSSDGLPDINAFDLKDATASCPTSIAGVFDFGPPVVQTAVSANFKFVDGYYHVVSCPYTGTGDLSEANFGYTNQNYFEIFNLINPQNDPNAPNAQLIYAPIWISQLSDGDEITYNRLQTVTSSRNVQVLATLSPQITFRLVGLPANQVYCGVINQQTTTGTLADFGTVTNQNFTNVAQRLLVDTNVNNGFVVTALASDQMGLENNLGVAQLCSGNGVSNDGCLPFAQVAGMSATQTQPWSNLNQGRGLGFTLENITGNDNVFAYNQGYRQFSDEQMGELPVAILDAGATIHSSANNVCYRLVATDNNFNGNYSNSLTYTLTAKF